jgi:cytochrome c oxidase subunit 2
MLAGLVIPNERDALAEWITDSQHLKPGNLMPSIDLTAPALGDLLDYLESLR